MQQRSCNTARPVLIFAAFSPHSFGLCHVSRSSVPSPDPQPSARLGESGDCRPDGTAPTADEPGTYVPTARPGSRAQHAWLRDGRSTLDLFVRGFKLMGLGADASEAAPLIEAAASRRVPLTFVRLDEPEVLTLYERRLVLVRPDGHVAWRDDRVPDDPLALFDRIRGAA